MRMDVLLESLSLVVHFFVGRCVHMSPVPILGGSLLASSSSSSWLVSADALFLLDRDFFFFFRGDEKLLVGGGLCRMKRVRSSPGRTTSGGGSKVAEPSGGRGRLAGAGGRATAADMAYSFSGL